MRMLTFSLRDTDTMKRTLTKVFLVIFAVAALIALALALTPWSTLIEGMVKAELALAGFKKADFSIEHIDLQRTTIKGIEFGEKIPVTAEQVDLNYALQNFPPQEMQQLGVDGTWKISALEVRELSQPMPPLSGEGTFARKDGGHWQVGGSLASEDKRYGVTFKGSIQEKGDTGHVVISAAHMPWQQGTVSSKSAVIYFSGKKRVEANVTFTGVSLDALMQLLTGGRASATGVVSGTLPVMVDNQNVISVGEGKLKAQDNGVIKLQPGAIPDSNEQVKMVNDVLSNFHYNRLEIISDNSQGKFSLMLSVEGSNPDAYEGKPVKLNVHLTGDVLDFVQQSVLPLTDPSKLLE